MIWHGVIRMGMDESKFREAVAQSIQEGLEVFGENPKKLILYYVERRYKINLDLVSEKPSALASALRDILGEGSKVVERHVLANLYRRLGLEMEPTPSENFERSILEAKTASRGLAVVVPSEEARYHSGTQPSHERGDSALYA